VEHPSILSIALASSWFLASSQFPRDLYKSRANPRFLKYWSKQFAIIFFHVLGPPMPFHVPDLGVLNLFAHFEACFTLFTGTSTWEDEWGLLVACVDLQFTRLSHDLSKWLTLFEEGCYTLRLEHLTHDTLELALTGTLSWGVLLMVCGDFFTLETYTSALEETWEAFLTHLGEFVEDLPTWRSLEARHC